MYDKLHQNFSKVKKICSDHIVFLALTQLDAFLAFLKVLDDIPISCSSITLLNKYTAILKQPTIATPWKIVLNMSRSIHQSCSIKNVVLKIFAIFTRKTLSWSLSLIFHFSPSACNFIKRRLQHSCFAVNIAKFLRTLILKNICKRLFLYIVKSLWRIPSLDCLQL